MCKLCKRLKFVLKFTDSTRFAFITCSKWIQNDLSFLRWLETGTRFYFGPFIPPFRNLFFFKEHKFSSVQLLSCVRLFATPWIAAWQASLSITNSRSSLKLMSIKSVMPPSHLILCGPLFLLPAIPPIIRVFSNESTSPFWRRSALGVLWKEWC